MNYFPAILLFIVLGLSWRVGASFGWIYHVAGLLIVLFVSILIFRAVARPLSVKKVEVPNLENEEAIRLVEEMEKNRRELEIIQKHISLDAHFIPVVLILPLLLSLFLFGNSIYDHENRIWLFITTGSIAAFLVMRARLYQFITEKQKFREPVDSDNEDKPLD